MIYNAGRRQVNQGGYCLGAIQAKRLKALYWWVRARICEQEEVNGYGVEWTIAACQEAMLLWTLSALLANVRLWQLCRRNLARTVLRPVSCSSKLTFRVFFWGGGNAIGLCYPWQRWRPGS